MILLTAGALTDPQLPARASNVYTTDARLGGIGRVASTGWNRPGGIDRVASAGCPPPNKNPGYAGGWPYQYCIVGLLIALSRCNRVFTRRLRLCHSDTVHRHEVRKGDREGPNRVVSEL